MGTGTLRALAVGAGAALLALVVRARLAVDLAPRPISVAAPELFVAVLAGILAAWGLCPAHWTRARITLLASGVLVGLAALLLPLALMRLAPEAADAPEAPAIVVLGARAYADGTPSLALEDRMATAIALYRRGGAQTLVCSGGPGDGAFHEVDVMHRLALEAGVSEDAIALDREGLNTRSTARNVARELQGASVIAVSQRFHVPRVELAFAREGLRARGVAAQETRPLAKEHWFTFREVVAFWAYWLRPRR